MLYKILKILDIPFQEIEHDAVFTVSEALLIKDKIKGVGCKNLFLTDGKQYYLYILEDIKRADLRGLAIQIEVSKLSFASVEKLMELLHLKAGSVTPFGILYDPECKVQILLDHGLQNKRLLFHPNVNTKTLSIEFVDLIRFIEYENHLYRIVL